MSEQNELKLEILFAKMETTMNNMIKTTESRFDQLNTEVKAIREAMLAMSDAFVRHTVECERKFITIERFHELFPLLFKEQFDKNNMQAIKNANEKMKFWESLYRIFIIIAMVSLSVAQFIK